MVLVLSIIQCVLAAAQAQMTKGSEKVRYLYTPTDGPSGGEEATAKAGVVYKRSVPCPRASCWTSDPSHYAPFALKLQNVVSRHVVVGKYSIQCVCARSNLIQTKVIRSISSMHCNTGMLSPSERAPTV